MNRAPRTPKVGSRDGFALVSVLFMALFLVGLLYVMFELTNRELQSTATDAAMTSGFFAAEAGLNVRGEEIRREFEGYRRPGGTTSSDACENDDGSGDFACRTSEVNQRSVTTYVEEDPRNNATSDDERLITVPPGEVYAGLNAIEYRYSVFSEAVPPNDTRPEAILEMVFRTRLVPMFQFAAFYDKDLEILPGPDMTLDGRVHSNGELYLDSDGNTLTISGQVTTAGGIHRGRKDRSVCDGDLVLPDGTPDGRAVDCSDPDVPASSFDAVPDAYFADFAGQVRTRLDPLTVPEPEAFDIGGAYYEEADVRIALDLTGASPRPVVLTPELAGGQPQVDESLTATLNTCLAMDVTDPVDRPYAAGSLPGYEAVFADGNGTDEVRAVEYSRSFYDNREGATLSVLEIDAQGVLDCLDANAGFAPDQFFKEQDEDFRGIDTERNGGLVWYLTVLGPDAEDAGSNYAVRVRNGATLASTDPDAPQIAGLTVASNQPAFVAGDYNRDADWRPAAFITDTVNVLSDAWGDSWTDADSTSWSARGAQTTEVNAAFLSGTDVTGGAEGAGGQGGAYNGGLENYPRFHENWSGRTFRYRGSFVSLGEPAHADGAWSYGRPVYTAPNRDWDYDARFNQAQNLPPLSPRFVYLVQERFIRDFER